MGLKNSLVIMYVMFPMIDGMVNVRMHQSSIFKLSSTCSFIRNTTLSNDASINSCIWECIDQWNCQTANFDQNKQICSLFKEVCPNGSIHSSGTDLITVICSKKSSNPMESCSSTTETTIVSSTEIMTIDSMSSSIGNVVCNISACRLIIVDQMKNNVSYNTTNFSECNGCSPSTYPNFPEQFFHRWYTEDFLIWSSAGQDCQGNSYTGDLRTCHSFCLIDPTCVGFSREKNVADNNPNGQCWLKNNIQQNRSHNHVTWHTFAFNGTF